MKKISKHFLATLKLDPRPAYEICQLAGIDSSWLSKAIYGAVKLEGFEKRIERVGKFLGLKPEEVFHKE